MRALRVASLALAGTTAALALGAPAALAEDGGTVTSFGFTVSPEDVEPGGTVTLNATECESPTVTASSGVFDTVTLSEGLPATATVFEDAEPGAEYDVTFDCEGEKGTTTLSVGGAEDDHTPPSTGTHTSPTYGPSGLTKPGGGVQAGSGGSLSGLSPTQIALGSLLVAGAVGGGVVMLRRRAGDGI
ncbi:hypothetical protein [Streptomyces sp. NPDC096193]|uniref:hypothetical protein n=1 Tax=Streptomyces sp. NPDC096193 TaxID=3155821 RepID=UPI0033258082